MAPTHSLKMQKEVVFHEQGGKHQASGSVNSGFRTDTLLRLRDAGWTLIELTAARHGSQIKLWGEMGARHFAIGDDLFFWALTWCTLWYGHKHLQREEKSGPAWRLTFRARRDPFQRRNFSICLFVRNRM